MKDEERKKKVLEEEGKGEYQGKALRVTKSRLEKEKGRVEESQKGLDE